MNDFVKAPMVLLESIDKVLGLGIDSLDKVGALNTIADIGYYGLKKLIQAQLKFRNDLDVEGLANIPQEGGIVLASNHQSWLDIFTLISACPRRVHFVAKAEFQQWPLMRQGIRISQSLFVKRGGDKNALDPVVEFLKEGHVVAIYPEGTIPGEEEIPRRFRDPKTGLLEGRTGAVRLALRAGVPIVPVGVSGTERALPPEVWPRKDQLRLGLEEQ